MYRLLAIAKYEDRYVIPTAHAERARELEEMACSLDYEGGPGMGGGGPFGSSSGRACRVAVETFHALRTGRPRTTPPAIAPGRVNLLNWDGNGAPPRTVPAGPTRPGRLRRRTEAAAMSRRRHRAEPRAVRCRSSTPVSAADRARRPHGRFAAAGVPRRCVLGALRRCVSRRRDFRRHPERAADSWMPPPPPDVAEQRVRRDIRPKRASAGSTSAITRPATPGAAARRWSPSRRHIARAAGSPRGPELPDHLPPCSSSRR